MWPVRARTFRPLHRKASRRQDVARARADFSILEARRAKVLICGPCARGLFEISLTVRDADAASAREDFSYGSDSGI